MAEYVLMTDSDSDLPYALKVKYDIPVVSMPYALNGKEYFDDLGQSLNYKDYFDAMRSGAAPVTAALNEEAYLEYFEPVLAAGKDLLFLAFSSQLSRTIQSVYAVQAQLKEKYPERRFIVVDTLAITAPQTLLILKAHEMYRAGADIETVAGWVEDNKLRVGVYLAVDDLKYLKRGGRISATAAVVGTMLDLKPIITLTREGTLTNCEKIRGRKKAMNYMLDKSLEAMTDPDQNTVIVMHADCEADAEKLRDMLLARKPEAEVIISHIGPVIGAHTGPGALGLCFLGKERA